VLAQPIARNEKAPARRQPRQGLSKSHTPSLARAAAENQDAGRSFHKKLRALVTLSRLRAPDCALRFAAVLLEHADGDGRAWPSTKRLQDLSGLSRGGVYKGQRWLVAHRLLRREKSAGRRAKDFVMNFAACDTVNLYGNLRNKFEWISRIFKSRCARADRLAAVAHLPHATPSGLQLEVETGLSASKAAAARQRLRAAGWLVDRGRGLVPDLPDPAAEAAAARWEAFEALWSFQPDELRTLARDAFLRISIDEQGRAIAQAPVYLSWCAARALKPRFAARFLREKTFDRVSAQREGLKLDSASRALPSCALSNCPPVHKIDPPIRKEQINRTVPSIPNGTRSGERGSPRKAKPVALAKDVAPYAFGLERALATMAQNVAGRPTGKARP